MHPPQDGAASGRDGSPQGRAQAERPLLEQAGGGANLHEDGRPHEAPQQPQAHKAAQPEHIIVRPEGHRVEKRQARIGPERERRVQGVRQLEPVRGVRGRHEAMGEQVRLDRRPRERLEAAARRLVRTGLIAKGDKMTFEEANDRYLDILKRISYIENPAEKENMYDLARLTVGAGLLCSIGDIRLDTELRIGSLEKILSTLEA